MTTLRLLTETDPVRFERLNTAELRQSFLLDDLFASGRVHLVYTPHDRAVVGSAVPAGQNLVLETCRELACEYFTQRRELGVINVGAAGTIQVGDKTYAMANKDVLYIGRGNKNIVFGGDKSDQPAKFFLISFPAHTDYPTAQSRKSDAQPVALGTPEACNQRVIYKCIHPAGVKSCQLVMGFTELAPGSVWNTMPPHTHGRRCEIYLYSDLDNGLVFHYMGPVNQTRHVVVRNHQAVVSPSWSIHAGVGIKNYCFVWAMGGENQDFTDMDAIDVNQLQ